MKIRLPEFFKLALFYYDFVDILTDTWGHHQ